MYATGVLDLERMEPRLPAYDEVDFGPASRASEEHGGVAPRMRRSGPQVLSHQAVERVAADLGGAVKGSRWPQGAEYARVDG